MAELRIVLIDLDDKEIEPELTEMFELQRDVDAPCDALRVSMLNSRSLPEINRVKAYLQDKLIFNGYVDTQREALNNRSYSCFIYARSSACLLVDNDAKPFTYNHPSAYTLFAENIREFGFEYALPRLYTQSQYQVSRGTSCYSALNNFVYGITGKNVIVDCDNKLCLAQNDIKINLNDYDIISEQRIINRGNAISRIDYKNDSAGEYIFHIKSRFFDEKKICRSEIINCSSYPMWQKKLNLINRLRSSAEEYMRYRLEIDGLTAFELYGNTEYYSDYLGDTGDCYISSCTIRLDKNGEKTKIIINRKIDIKEISYVAK